MQLDEIISLLDRTPIIAEMHPVSACYLPDEIMIFESTHDIFFEMDNPSPTLPAKMLVMASDIVCAERFPRTICEHNPFTPILNEILFDRFDCVSKRMFCQSQITERIVANTRQSPEVEVIVLFLIDGLSYQNSVQHIGGKHSNLSIEPCLVDVPTFTSLAFPNIINDPPLALRLFDMGYQNALGVSYWTRDDNTLTDSLFRTIPQVEKISDFQHILFVIERFLKDHPKQKVYVQVLRTGLDGYVHHQKRQPPIRAIIHQIYQELELLGELFTRLGLNAQLYSTSDHGILWRDEFEAELVGNAPGKSSARWCTWKDLYQQNEPGKRFVVNQQEYYCLGYPKLRRALHIDEQGVHGGISFQESIVPFITMGGVEHD